MPRRTETIFVPSNKNAEEQYQVWRKGDGRDKKRPIVKYEPMMGGTRVVISYEVSK